MGPFENAFRFELARSPERSNALGPSLGSAGEARMTMLRVAQIERSRRNQWIDCHGCDGSARRWSIL